MAGFLVVVVIWPKFEAGERTFRSFKMAAAVQKVTSLGTRLYTFTRPHWNTFVGHARRELGPPTDLSAVQREAKELIAKAPGAMNTPVRRAFQNTLVAVEIAMWFYVGEIIGRGSIIGYKTK